MIPVRRTFRHQGTRNPSTPQKPFLYPAGTPMAEVPPLARGVSEMEYLDACIAKCKAAPVEPLPAAAAPAVPAFGRRRA